MQEVMLIAKYFGTLQPVAQQALRTLPHVASQMASSMAAHKRETSTKPLTDSELIHELFKSHAKTEK